MGFTVLQQWAIARVGTPRRAACSLFLVLGMRVTDLRWIDLVSFQYCWFGRTVVLF